MALLPSGLYPRLRLTRVDPPGSQITVAGSKSSALGAPPAGLDRHLLREGAGDRGGAAGHAQAAVDVLQVLADRALGDAEPPADLDVGVPGGDQPEQVPLPGGELGPGPAAQLRVLVGLPQVRAQQPEHGPVPLAEIRARAAEQEHPQLALWL